jgi:hypothetical protein
MNWNFVGSIYGRFSLNSAHFISIRCQTWPPQAILVSDWPIFKNLLLWNRLAKWTQIFCNKAGTAVVMIVWQLDLQLSVQSVPITTEVVRSNLAHGEVFSIQHYVIKFVVTVFKPDFSKGISSTFYLVMTCTVQTVFGMSVLFKQNVFYAINYSPLYWIRLWCLTPLSTTFQSALWVAETGVPGEFRVITVFTVFRLLTDFVCLYNYKFWLFLCKIVRSSVILLLPLLISICTLNTQQNITKTLAKVKTYNYINRQNQSTSGKLWKP